MQYFKISKVLHKQSHFILIGAIIMSLLKIKKLRQVIWLAQGHITSEFLRQDLNLSYWFQALGSIPCITYLSIATSQREEEEEEYHT